MVGGWCYFTLFAKPQGVALLEGATKLDTPAVLDVWLFPC